MFGAPLSVPPPTRRVLLGISWGVMCLVTLARPAAPRAFVLPPGEGAVTVTDQNTLGRGHLLPSGVLASSEAGRDPVRAHVLTWDVASA